jgi:hypothetical protein
MDGLSYDETLFSYLYTSSMLRWQDMAPEDWELIPQIYAELINRQFIPFTVIERDLLSMAITLSRIENVLVESQLTPSAAWLMGYMIDVQREFACKMGGRETRGRQSN